MESRRSTAIVNLRPHVCSVFHFAAYAEKAILKKLEDQEVEWSLANFSSRDELQANLVARMKSVTNASEDVCVSLLQRNSYDLNESVEAYLSP